MEIDYISDSPEDYIDMCRACMGKGDLKPLFFDYKTSCPSLLDIFIQVTGLNICKNDGLPSHICTACISLIQSASHFKEMCFQSDQTFRKGLASTVVTQTPSIKDEQDPYTISEMEPINFMGSNKENEKQQKMEELSSKNSPLAPYKCGLCTTGFDICNKLKEHVKIFHGDQLKATRLALKTKYTCSVCSKDFRTEKGYSSHYKRCDKRIKVKEEFISDSDSDTPLSVKVANRNLDTETLLKEDTLMDETDDKTSFDNHSDIYYDNDNHNHNIDIHYNDIKVEVVDEPIIKKERKKYSCNECDLTLTKSLYNAHMESVHPTKKKSLKKKVVSRKKKMNGELGEHNEPEKLLQCSYCERKFLKESSRQLHIAKHEKELNIIHKCDTCGREFKRRAHLENHLLSHAGDTGFKCDICTKAFSKQESLNVHMASHKGLKKHQCPHCDKGFNMLSTLKDHIRTHTGEKPFLCSICGRGFSQSTNLKEHMRRHQGFKPFKCSTCSQTFVSKGELEAHLRKHSGAHPFVCDECGGGFTTSSSLVKHKRIHTGERPYKCDFCNMTFTALGTMKNHRRTHTGEKPYKCQYCEKAFVQKNDLVTHTRTHTGERPYVCTVCGHAFRQSSALKTHSKIHGGSMDLMPVGVTLTRNNEQLIEINRPSLEENNSLNVMTPKSENSNI